MRPLPVLVLTFLVGCAPSSPEEAIVGKWQHIADQSITEFFQNGTISASGPKGDVHNGSYLWLDDNTIRVDLGGLMALAGPQIWDVSIARDELTVSWEGTHAGRATYRRIED